MDFTKSPEEVYFQRWIFDPRLGGSENIIRQRGLGRNERDQIFGSKRTERRLACAEKLKEILIGETTS